MTKAIQGASVNGERTREYRSWMTMKTRCYNSLANNFHNYGGRGITVCDRWRHDFAAFLADMGPRPEGHTLDRVDNNGNYEPGNCRWATVEAQSRSRRGLRIVMYNDRLMCIGELAKMFGLDHTMLNKRIRRGWPLEEAIRTPVQKRRTVAEMRAAHAATRTP